jgi:hypothetical protein
MTITEDTPDGGPDELQWKIDRLIEQNERQVAETERFRAMYRDMAEHVAKLDERHKRLTDRLTVGVLRKAGFRVEIHEPECCDTCGEDY